MLTTESLSETQWQIAHNIAITLVKENADVNELGKAIAYLRAVVNQPNAGARFFKYLKTLVSNGRQIRHSDKTPDYYRSIERTCNQYLQKEQANAEIMLVILGWAARLMRYYKDASPIEEITPPPTPPRKQGGETEVSSQRQAQIAEIVQAQNFAVEQILDATVLGVKGNKVTYEMLGTIKLTEKEPKKAASLQEGQVVKVKITALKEDGSIKSVKCVD
jgi:nucleoid DNA-binding protein